MKFLDSRDTAFLSYNWEEFKHMAISSIFLGFAFPAAFSTVSGTFGFLLSGSFWPMLVFFSLAAFLSLWLKTSIQKWTARMMESYLDYEYWGPGLVIAFLASFLGVPFGAVGGVKISTEYAERFGRWRINLRPQQMGIISSVGILLFVAIGMVFYLLAGTGAIYGSRNLFLQVAQLNGFIALFSMVPTDFLDGTKVMRWNWAVWSVLLLLVVVVLLLFMGVI